MAATEYLCEVKFNRMITPTVFELGFEADKPVTFKAGQFISVIIPGAGPKGRDLRRAYSIASAPQVRPIELCVKLVGDGPGTNYLYSLKPGDKFRGFAPYGDFIYKTKPSRHACFIATGTGVAPFRSMVFSEDFDTDRPLSSTCLLGVSNEKETLYSDEMSTHSKLRWVVAVSRPMGDWKGFKGRVTDYLRSLGSDFPWLETDYYLCGNGAMIDETKLLLADKGVTKEMIHQEIYYKPPKDERAG